MNRSTLKQEQRKWEDTQASNIKAGLKGGERKEEAFEALKQHLMLMDTADLAILAGSDDSYAVMCVVMYVLINRGVDREGRFVGSEKAAKSWTDEKPAEVRVHKPRGRRTNAQAKAPKSATV